MPASAVAGWIAFALVPGAAVAGSFLQRCARGPFIRRMRAHFIIGYGAFALAVLHLVLSSGGMGGANATGMWFALFAFAGVGLQAFLGTNLQSPGAYRPTLRGWHVLTFWSVLALIALHVLLNGAFIAAAMGQQ